MGDLGKYVGIGAGAVGIVAALGFFADLYVDSRIGTEADHISERLDALRTSVTKHEAELQEIYRRLDVHQGMILKGLQDAK